MIMSWLYWRRCSYDLVRGLSLVYTCVGGEKTSPVHATPLQFPQNFKKFGNFCRIYSNKLSLSYMSWPCSDEEAIKAFSCLHAGIPCNCLLQANTTEWHNLSQWSLLIASKMMQCRALSCSIRAMSLLTWKPQGAELCYVAHKLSVYVE